MIDTKAEKIENASEDYATSRVPLDKRRSTFSVAMVASGFCISMSGLFAGASMAAGLDLKQAILAAIIGNTILSVFGGAIGAAGAREGLSASRLSIYSFGSQGFKIVSLVIALTMAGWFAVQCGLLGNTINAMFPNGGFLTNANVAAFWGGILMFITAYFGYKGLNALSTPAVPLIAITATIGTVVAIKSAGGWEATMNIVPTGGITLSAGIVMAVGSFAAGAAAQADITRYSKTPKAAWIATIFGYLIANSFIMVAGYLTTLTTGIGDLPKAMLGLGLGIPALIVLILAQWTTNANNIYTSSLGLSNILPISKGKITLVIGVVGSVLGGLGIANYFTDWLGVLGIGVPPMAGVIIADYYILKKKNYRTEDESKLPSWNINALIAWAIACIVGFTVTIGIAAINSLITSMIVYIILMKINPIKNKTTNEK